MRSRNLQLWEKSLCISTRITVNHWDERMIPGSRRKEIGRMEEGGNKSLGLSGFLENPEIERVLRAVKIIKEYLLLHYNFIHEGSIRS